MTVCVQVSVHEQQEEVCLSQMFSSHQTVVLFLLGNLRGELSQSFHNVAT